MPRIPATLLAAALSLAVALAPSPAALAQEPSEPTKQEIGLLFTQTAKRGTLTPVEGKPRFTLKLHGVAHQAVWFSDRPARGSGQIPIRGFVREWEGFGFDADHPNAALTLLNAANAQDTVVLELGEPRYRAKSNTVRYSARVLDEATGNLSHLESQRDRRVPRHFGDASLFIDDATGPVLNGCVIEPFIVCKQLGQENVTGEVTVFNPTGTGYEITVNGGTELPIPASTPTTNWMPATGANPIPRTGSGEPADGEFGWDNLVTVSPTSGGGSPAQANVSFPHSLQTDQDLELYLFYSGDPSTAVWVLLWEGEVQDSGGMTAG